jgi:acyl carrier protein
VTGDADKTQPSHQEEEVFRTVRAVVASSLELPEDEVRQDSSLYELGAESLDLLEMAFKLEKEYQISFPSTGILERAAAHFGKDALSSDGVVTELGLHLLRMGMPELNPELLKPGLRDIDVTKMIEVQSLVRITMRLLDAKAQFPRTCVECGEKLVESTMMPEFECSGCGRIVPVPRGDDILLQDLIDLHQRAEGGS